MFVFIRFCIVAIAFNIINAETFLDTTDADAVKRSYSQFISQVKNGSNGTLFAKLSNDLCQHQMEAYVKDLFDVTSRLDRWSLMMFDASGKMPAGILTGNNIDMGNFDECLAVENSVESIRGKYCYAGLLLPLDALDIGVPDPETRLPAITKNSINYAVSLCMPSACEPMEFMQFLTNGANIPSKMINNLMCTTTDDTDASLDSGDWTFIGFILTIVIISCASTLYDMRLRKHELKPVHPICLAFSILTNGEKIFKTSNNPGQLHSLNGLRVFSIMWIIAGHRFALMQALPMLNKHYAFHWVKYPESEYVQGAPSAVDTFLFISGTLMAYGFIQSQSRPKARFNIILFYVHRYLRLTPALAVVYFYYVTIADKVASGPQWASFMKGEQQRCTTYWYSFFLYIQNFVNVDKLCLLHTWYLSLDMQIFILSPIVLIPLVKSPKKGIFFTIFLTILSIITAITICWAYDLQMYTKPYDHYYYYMPHTRASPYLVGIIFGAVLLKYKDRKFKISPFVNLGVWTVVIFLLGAILYLVNYYAYDNYATVESAFLVGLHRPIWAVCLCWIIFACVKGYGGPINWLLSLPLFQIVARITYSMYLVHILMLILSSISQRTPHHWDDLSMLSHGLSDIVIVSFVGLLWTLFFESPMIVVEKIIFGGGAKPQEKVAKIEVPPILEQPNSVPDNCVNSEENCNSSQ